MFKLGDRVRTKFFLEDRDFAVAAAISRRPDVVGTIVRISNAHGLCYGVYHDCDQEIAFYDPDELILIG